MKISYKQEKISRFLDALAAKLPSPGGGSAAALSAAMGACLLSMVVNFTLGKPKYSSYFKDLRRILNTSEKARGRFLELMDEDIVAYSSKDMRQALAVPLEVARLSLKTIGLCRELTQKGNTYLASDVACAAILLEAAFTAAYFNVQINLKMSRDKKLSRKITREFYHARKKIQKIRRETEERVGQIIRG